MATAAKDLEESDREAEVKDRKETKNEVNGGNHRNSKQKATQKRSPPKKKNKGQRNEDTGVRNSTETASKRRGGHRKNDNQSKRGNNKQRSSFRRSYPLETKTYLFDKKRNAEFMREFNQSDDDEPDWDERLREVKQNFSILTLRKKMEARKIWAEIEEARSSTDSNKSDSNESEKEEAHWDSKLRTDKSAIIKDGRKYSLVHRTEDAQRDGSDKEAWFWDSGEEDSPSTTKDTEKSKYTFDSTAIKVRVGKTRENNESDEDPWFWDSHGDAPPIRGGTSKRDKDGKDSSQPGEQTPHVKNKVGAQLKHSIEKLQLKEFKKEYYEKLNNPDNSDSSSTKSSSSSSDSTLSSEIEDMIRSPAERKNIAYRFLDDSSEDEVIIYTSKGWTIRRSPAVVAVKEIRRHHWSDESSTSSRNTSRSDTEKSSGSQNDAPTD